MSAPRLAPGQVVAGKYSIRSLLGYGGATATYAAGLGPGRDVVVRLLSPQLAQRGDVLASLQQAGAFTNSLPADATAAILESGFDPQTGAPFTVTELVPLPSLAQAANGGPLAVADVVAILQAIARAVDAAHAQRVAHGGIKPQNVLIGTSPQRSVRVIDFGMALVRAALPTPEGHANAAPWMAPEQLQGSPASPASDVFSAALVAFFAATGKPYWRSCQGPTAPDLAALQHELAVARAPVSTRARELGASLAVGFDAVLGRALAPNPAERFVSLGELAAAVAKEGGPQKLAMTMPLNAMSPDDARDLMRKVAAAATKPGSSAASAPVGGTTLAIQSPLEARQWPPQAAPHPAQPRFPDPQMISDPQGRIVSEASFAETQAVPHMLMPQPQMPQQPMPPQMPVPQMPMPQQPMPPPGLAIAQGPMPSWGPAPPESAVVVPKSRIGLIVGIVVGVLVLGGVAAGAVSYMRARVAARAAEAAAHAAAQSTFSPPGSPAQPPAENKAAAAAPSSSAQPAVEAVAIPAPTDAGAPAASEIAEAAAPAASQPADAAAPDQAVVAVVCVPECDSIKVDDKSLENESDASLFPSPEAVHLSAGMHTITVGKATFLPQTKRLTLKAGQRDKATFFLIKPQAAVPTKQCGKFLERCP